MYENLLCSNQDWRNSPDYNQGILLSVTVKGLNFQGYSVVHHPDPDESGIFPLINGKPDNSQSFAFMSEHTSLVYLKAELMLAQQFGKTTGYEKWHRRLGHTSNKEIQDTIKHVIGLEEILQTHTKCASCMIGKSTLEEFPIDHLSK